MKKRIWLLGILLMLFVGMYSTEQVEAHSLLLEDRESTVLPQILEPQATALQKEQKVLVLLVEFENQKLNYEESIWTDKLFSKNKKSLTHYFNDETGGRIDIVPVEESNTNQAGIVKVKLDYDHPNPGGTMDQRNQKITKDALIKADSLIDYKKYDTNRNGIIEQNELHVMTIVAGYSYESTMSPSVHSHQWALFGENDLKLDNTKLFYYLQFGETASAYMDYRYRDVPMTLGLICHEFGHDLGLPDLYGDLGLYHTSLMDIGEEQALPGEYDGQTPTGLDAYSKMKLGVPVKTVDLENDSIIAVSADNYAENVLFKISTENSLEYILIDNRQLEGYDQAMAGTRGTDILGSGIGIYKINENYTTNTGSGRLVRLLEADEGVLGYSNIEKRTRPKDPFYYVGNGGHGQSQQTTLSKTSKPSTEFSNGMFGEFAIEVLDESSETMRIKISKNKAVEDISFSFTEQTLEMGESLTALPEFIPKDATNQRLVFETSDDQIASIDNTGKIKALNIGKCTIRATSVDGKKTTNFELNVIAPIIPIEDILITQPFISVYANQTAEIPVSLSPAEADITSVDLKIATSSIAEVTKDGKILGKKDGQTLLTITSKDGRLKKEIIVLVGDDYHHSKELAYPLELDKAYDGLFDYANDMDYFEVKVEEDETLILEIDQPILYMYKVGKESSSWQMQSSHSVVRANKKNYYQFRGNSTVSKYVFCVYGRTKGIKYNLKLMRGGIGSPIIKNSNDLNLKEFQIGETFALNMGTEHTAFSDVFAFKSYNNEVVGIDSNGIITAKKLGEAQIEIMDVVGNVIRTVITVADDYTNFKEKALLLELEKDYVGKFEYANDHDYFKTSVGSNETIILETNQSIQYLYVYNKESNKYEIKSTHNVTRKDNKFYYRFKAENQIMDYIFSFYGRESGKEYNFKIVAEAS